MARRDWDKLQEEFTELEQQGVNLTEFCKIKGLSRSSAGRQLKTMKRLSVDAKPQKLADFEKKKKEGGKPEKTDFQTRHMTDEKIMFYVEANKVSRKHAEFIHVFFRSDSMQEAADKMQIPVSTAYSYMKNEAVQKTVDDVTATAFEVEVTTPTRIRGRMCAIANANIQDFFNEKGEMKLPHLWTRSQGLAVKEIKVKPNEYGTEYTLKMYDAMSALDTLGAVHGLFDKPDEADELNGLTDEELDELINEQENLLDNLANSPDN